MAKTEMTKFIESVLWEKARLQGVYGCFEVTIGVDWSTDGIVDFITYDSYGEFRCYEIKVSKSDFKSKAKLSFVGDFNYYVIPTELLDELRKDVEKELSKYEWRKGEDNSRAFDERLKNQGIGLITVNPRGNISIAIKPKRKYLKAMQRSNLLESMVRSQSRELVKFYKEKPYWGLLNEVE